MPTPYRQDLALVHDVAFGFHAERVAPGVLALLEPLLAAGGLVLELGAGTGALTSHLVAAGHRVVATDASPDMVARGRARLPDRDDVLRWDVLTLPDDPLPAADAVVAVGHPLNYLPDAAALERALAAAARALRPGGVLAVDVCDLAWGVHAGRETQARLGDDWALFTRFSLPEPDRYVRELTTFVRTDGGTWRRDDERHDNVLVDVAALPAVLAPYGVEATVGHGFGAETLPDGLLTLVGRKASRPGVGGITA